MEPTLEKTTEAPATERIEVEAAAAGSDRSKADYRMIAFSLAGRDYGIDIMKVKEISHEGKFTYVPNTAPYVLGVHNLRGEIIPIIDMRRMFNLAVPEVREGAEQNILILKLEKLVLGVVVDSIDGVMSTPQESIQPPHPLFSDINLRYMRGIVEKEGKLFVVLDVERIFQESAQLPKRPTVKAEKPQIPVEKAANQEMRFVCEGLATFASFYAVPMNIQWIERRFGEWSRLRAKAGISVQLRGTEDAQEFLETFGSPSRTELWDEQTRAAVLSFLPPAPSGAFVVWNYGCGRGLDVYSAVCALRHACRGIVVKAWANDANLVEITSAPTLAFTRDRVPQFYIDGGFVREGESGFQFVPAVRDSIIFEYTESLSGSEGMEADLVIARDVLSFLPLETQQEVLAAFSSRLKPGGLLILGVNEQIEGGDWRKVEKGGLHAFVREGAKE